MYFILLSDCYAIFFHIGAVVYSVCLKEESVKFHEQLSKRVTKESGGKGVKASSRAANAS